GIALKALGRGDLLKAVLTPQPPGVAEGRHAALGGDAGTGEHQHPLVVSQGKARLHGVDSFPRVSPIRGKRPAISSASLASTPDVDLLRSTPSRPEALRRRGLEPSGPTRQQSQLPASCCAGATSSIAEARRRRRRTASTTGPG